MCVAHNAPILAYHHRMEKPETLVEIGEYSLLRRGGKLYVAHASVRAPVELAPHLLISLFKRVLREAIGL
jgi:hypothetical protein